jgi:hypothetical protein
VDVADTLHVDFSEMNFWGGPLRQRGAFGTIAPERALELTRLIARSFFGQEILKQPTTLFSDSQPLPGLTVRELRRP